MKRVYLDNAATTPVAPEVAEIMAKCIAEDFGNPSSTHSFGRASKGLIETSRRTIAKHLNCQPKEIIFTSGGTEADNMAIHCAIYDLKVERIISSPIEHHAVSHTVEHLCNAAKIELVWLTPDKQGHIDLAELERYLQDGKRTLVSLMHANNEIGTLLDLRKTGDLCAKYGAYFHSDTVQTMGHYSFDLSNLHVDFITCAAHKFHGPKGVGFLYINSRIPYHSMIHGGAQERGLRGGTENLYGIVGLAKAMDLAYEDVQGHQTHVQELKTYFMNQLRTLLPGVEFHGDTTAEGSLYTVLNVNFPPTDKASMLLFTLDIRGVACSGGSACSSGSNQGSHVLRGIGADPSRPNARFSFSRYTTKAEIDFALEQILTVYEPAKV
jgi:cysteine desulfurase